MRSDSPEVNPEPYIENLLRHAVTWGASDIHLAAGMAPVVRIAGDLRRINLPNPTAEEVEKAFDSLMSAEQREQWVATGRCEFMYSMADLARFRVRMFTQHRGAGAVIRILPHEVPELSTLGLPSGFTANADRTDRLVLFTGYAGCGRTTTLMSMLCAIGSAGPVRMASIGQLIEFDLSGRFPGLKQIASGQHSIAIREACDAGAEVIAVDDASDPVTMIEALHAAQQGRTVLCGMRAENTRLALDEIIRRCPEGKETVQQLLADTLRMVLGQRWVRTARGGRTLAYEVLIGTPAIRNLIRDRGVQFALYSAMQTGGHIGFQTFGQEVTRLFRERHITEDEAASHYNNPDAFGGRDGKIDIDPYEYGESSPEIPTGIFAPEAIEKPGVFEHIAHYRHGLIVVSGPPGSGRSATAAYLLSLVVARRLRHIVTIESQAEYVFEDSVPIRGRVTRHVLQAGSIELSDAVRAALSEDPDVLFIGVEPDAVSLQLMLDAAHSGLLVILVLPARSAVQALEYLRDRIPSSEWGGLNRYLIIRAVLAQRLVPRVGGGRVAAYEILIGTPAVRNLIHEWPLDRLQPCIETGAQYGMQTLGRHLSKLADAGTIGADDARLGEIQPAR